LVSQDPWVIAQEAKTGQWDKPGEELAKRLCDEKMPAMLEAAGYKLRRRAK
jgi:hypothetical protein